MDPYDYSAMRRELVYQEFMIRYLQEEQKKRWEELHELEQQLEELKADPVFRKLMELAESMKGEPVAGPYEEDADPTS
jgi:hypothetical protein